MGTAAKKDLKLIVRCCICGKEKSENGWYYSLEDFDEASVEYTHGFCPICYENELNKLQWRKKVISAFTQ